MEENKFLGTDGFQELNLDELGRVAGGRGARSNEEDEYRRLRDRFYKEYDKRWRRKQYDSAQELNKNFARAVSKWEKAIANAPEDSEDILLSSFIDFWLP